MDYLEVQRPHPQKSKSIISWQHGGISFSHEQCPSNDSITQAKLLCLQGMESFVHEWIWEVIPAYFGQFPIHGCQLKGGVQHMHL